MISVAPLAWHDRIEQRPRGKLDKFPKVARIVRPILSKLLRETRSLVERGCGIYAKGTPRMVARGAGLPRIRLRASLRFCVRGDSLLLPATELADRRPKFPRSRYLRPSRRFWPVLGHRVLLRVV
jgi:hypothetical protein